MSVLYEGRRMGCRGYQPALRDLSEGCPLEAARSLHYPGPTGERHCFGTETVQQG